ncbi:hypothetical protein PaG_04621 [Moesziomyces aphidis]|uniref:Uncharacterized protein n=1 Tax=Moesziomyces aphidis TaxID=84754 RepID=W3VGE3_MOEAP|nr:hypothetical protein PaG_04621 [Moesziomyces aphidis]
MRRGNAHANSSVALLVGLAAFNPSPLLLRAVAHWSRKRGCVAPGLRISLDSRRTMLSLDEDGHGEHFAGGETGHPCVNPKRFARNASDPVAGTWTRSEARARDLRQPLVVSPFNAAAGPFQPSQRAKDPIGLSFVEPNQMTAACTDEARRAESRERGRMRSPSAGAETASWRADAADSSVPPRLARPWRGMEVRLARAALVLSHAKRSRVTASDTNCEPKAAATARKAWSASSRRSIKSA